MFKYVLVTTTALASIAGTAHAQSIDYSSLEMLFGEPVTTSATGKPQRASDAPASMIIITSEEIKRSGATNVPFILRRYAGIDVNQWTADGYDVTIRGGNVPFNPGLLVLVNGRQVYLDHYGYTDWSAIGVQLEEIQQIEVVKGPNSALFGFNAAVGVVNIITANPTTQSVNTLTAELGTDDQVRVAGVATLKLGEKNAVRLSAGYQTQTEFEDLAVEQVAFADTFQDDPENFSAVIDGYFQIAEKTQLNLEATYNDANKHTIVPYGNNFDFSEVKTFSLRGQVLHEGFGGLLKTQAYLNDLEHSIAAITIDQSVLVVQAEHVFKQGTNNAFRLMAEYRQNEFQTVDSISPFIQIDLAGKVGYDVFSTGGMWERVLTDKLTATGALRVDNLSLYQEGDISPLSSFTEDDFDQSFTEFSYNAGLVYKATDTDTLRFVTAKGAQSPSLVALGISNAFPSATAPGGIVDIPGDPTIEPSPVTSYELAYSKTASDINAKFDVTGFYTDHEDLISWPGTLPSAVPPATSFVTFSQFQGGEFQTYGVELSATGERENGVQWGFNYTYTEVEEDIPGQTFMGAIVLPVAYESMTPQHKANAHFGYEKGPWTLDVSPRYRSETEIPTSAGVGQPYTVRSIDGSVTVDFRAAYNVNDHVELYATGENAFDDETAGGSYVDAEPRLRIGLRGNF
jgi:iron complex outermembrane receptor protein